MFYFLQKKKTSAPNSKKRFNKKQIKDKLVNIVVGKTALGKMLRCYVLFVIVGAIFLYLPFSLQNGYWKDEAHIKGYTFFDALFMSTTAFTNTGIVNLNISTTFTTFGKWVILIITQLGGLGFVSILILIWNMFKMKRTSDLETNITLFNERGGGKIGDTRKTIVVSIIFVVIVEIIFTIIYSFWFYNMEAFDTGAIYTKRGPFYYDKLDAPVSAYHNAAKSVFWGIFHSVSAINNSGIDIIGANSLAPYRNDSHIFLQICFIIQIILGGIGYPIIYDIYEHISFRIKNKYHKVNLFTKIGLSGYFLVTVVGLLFLIAFEYGMKNSSVNYLDYSPEYFDANGNNITNNPTAFKSIYGFDQSQVSKKVYGDNPNANKFFAILFETFTTRSAGFATVNNNIFSQPSLWIITLLMFIGANPSSTGGGIRTVTFVIILVAIFSRFKKNGQVNLFRRKISDQTIYLSFLGTFSVLLISILFAIVGFACYDNNNYKLFDFFFICTSAFGTVGLNIMNFDFASAPEVIFLTLLIILMILGQLGISTVLFSPTRLKDKVSSFTYPSEDIKT